MSVQVRSRPALLEALRAAPLVPVEGDFFRADQLVDPHQPLLAKVFHGDPVFPTGVFRSWP